MNTSSLNAQQLAACENVRKAFLDFGRTAAVTLAPMMEQLGHSLIAYYTFLQDAYDRAGKPYGDAPEGLRRWCAEAAQAQRQAQAGDWKPWTPTP